MKEAEVNLWDATSDLVVVTTNGTVKRNGACVMGRGCAREAKQKYPGVEFLLGKYLRRYGNRPFLLHLNLASFPVKHDWWDLADYHLIAQSACLLLDTVNRRGYNDVVLPRPGCGNGGLSWKSVRKILEPILDDRFTVVTFPR